MYNDVTSLSYYSVNKTRLPGEAIITKEDNVVYDPAENPGTLIKIYLPYSFLGENHEWFITSSPRFTPANYPTNDPYAPVEDWSVFIDGRLTDNTTARLSLGGDYDVVSTYRPTRVQEHVVAYVNADNTANPALQAPNHRDIATMANALVSPYVKTIKPMEPTATHYYNSNTGVLNGTPFGNIATPITVTSDSLEIVSTVPLGNMDVTFTSPDAKSFVVNAPDLGNVSVSGISGEGSEVSIISEGDLGTVTITDDPESINIQAADDINGNVSITSDATSITVNSDTISGGVTITQSNTADAGDILVNSDVTGSVVIIADAADTITVRENIGIPSNGVGGNLTINSTSATAVRVDSSVTGNATITTPAAHVYIDRSQVGGSVTITSAAENSVTIANGVTIASLIINEASHGLKIYNGGTITNLVVANGRGYVRVLAPNGTNGTLPASTTPGTNITTSWQRATITSI
jgi:hypothetical protein